MSAGADAGADVVVVGSGIGGCASALFAANRGLRTVLIDKDSHLGGITSSHSGGVTWIGANHLYDATGPADADTTDRALEYLRFVGGGRQDDARATAYASTGRDALREAEASSISFQLVPQYVDLFSPYAPGSMAGGRVVEVEPFPMDRLGDHKALIAEGKRSRLRPRGASQRDLLSWKSRSDPRDWDTSVIRARNADGDRCSFGYGLVGAFVHALIARGVRIMTDTAMAELVIDDRGRAAGVRTAGPAGRIDARRGVVLASGGYEANPELVWLLEELREWKSPGPRSHTGDALLQASKYGAAIRRITPNLNIMFGFPSADPDVEMVSAGNSDLCLPHSLVVDAAGRRFGDESFFQDMSARIAEFDAKRHVFAHRGCYFIFDQQYLERFGLRGCRDPQALPDWVVSATTMAALAAMIGIDATRLEETVDTFNRSAVAGADPQFGRGTGLWSATIGSADDGQSVNRNVGPLNRSPYYACKLEVGGSGCAGLVTDTSARVLRWDGEPIEGLYAVGVAAAHTEYGVGYQAGFQLGGALTFGHRAAQALAGE